MAAGLVWEALRGGISSVVVGFPAAFPEWGKWLTLAGLVVVIAYIARRWAITRQVTLVDERLWVSSLTAAISIPLSQVEYVLWTQSPADSDTLEAMIVLSAPTTFGQRIVFQPKSAEAFELLRSKIEHRLGRDDVGHPES
ncbi:MAG TPA: hypothetical protein VI653_27695 [Steroidobacteraceae bacterium]